MKKIIILALLILITIITIITFCVIKISGKEGEIIQISSEEELKRIYEGESEDDLLKNILLLPFSLIRSIDSPRYISKTTSKWEDSVESNINEGRTISPDSLTGSKSSTSDIESSGSGFATGGSKEFSTTNIQVENVDEADITKTDGDYIYSLSEDKVIITDVRNPEEIKKVYEINNINDNVFPEELILYENKLVVIYQENNSTDYYYNSYKSMSNNDTMVYVYDISNKERPKEIKNYVLEQPYYTSRCINGKLYVISSGYLEKENDKIITSYKEDGITIDSGYKGIKKIKNLNTNKLTTLAMLDLNSITNPVKVNSYLMNVENAYVSEKNIYLLEEKYESPNNSPKISSILGVKGIFGAFENNDYDYSDSDEYTKIYKFNLLDDGNIKYDKRAEERGTTINQFSIDEYNKYLRIALHDTDGSRVVIFDNNLQKIGETEKLAKGETMYSSRFMGDRAYLVTYKTVDPLFAIDLSNPYKPKTLGKLKIPGYSTYLHPYDENHIIGIGMQTQERVNRNSYGRITSTTATITGMKMALFDVSDISKPIQISDTVIGDSKTTSAILTNHKALLFSKEKELIAIPVNNYEDDFRIEDTSDEYSSLINKYTSYNKNYISEGYFVYNLNLKDGFRLKGKIVHDKTKKYNRYSYYNTSRLLRGLYINNNLYTISEDFIKVNKLDDLLEISSMKIKGD